MAPSIVIPFPLGTILDREAGVWTTLASGTLAGALIMGNCSCDPSELSLSQVILERGAWRGSLLVPGQRAPFPVDRGFEIQEVAGPLGGSTRITVQVHRSFGAARLENGRLSRLALTTFQLELLVRGSEDS